MITQLELFPRLPTVRNPTTYWARYRNYLRSSAWQWVRRQTLAACEYRCQAEKPGCNGHASQVHHLTYLRWNNDGDRPCIDTIAVCDACHRWIHAHPNIVKAANDNIPLTGALRRA